MVGCASPGSRRRLLGPDSGSNQSHRRQLRRFLFTRKKRIPEVKVEETVALLNEELSKRNYCNDLPPEDCQVAMDIGEI